MTKVEIIKVFEVRVIDENVDLSVEVAGYFRSKETADERAQAVPQGACGVVHEWDAIVVDGDPYLLSGRVTPIEFAPELEERRAGALAKLTVEDMKILGLAT